MISSKYLLYKISAVEIRKLRFNPNHDKKTGEFTNGDGTGTQEKSKNYNEVSLSDWFPEAVPNSHEVKEMQEYTKDGVTYVVDGKHVINIHTEREKEVAQLLADKVGGEIQLVPKVNYPQGIKTPDYIFNGVEYDLKEIIGSGKNVVSSSVSKKKEQSSNFILDITRTSLKSEDISKQINRLYHSDRTVFIKEIVVVDKYSILKIYKRN